MRMGVYVPAALVSLTALSRSAARAAPTTAVGTVVSINAQASVKAMTIVKAQAQPQVKAGG